MTGPSSRVPVLLVLVWVGGLLAATSVGLLAVRLVAAQVGDPAVAPLSAVAAASGAASAAASGAAVPPAQPTPATTPTGVASSAAPGSSSSPDRPAPSTAPAVAVAPTQTFATAAGTLGVQCTGTALRLLYATPAQGYALDERSVGGAEAQVRFQGAGTRVRVRLSCASGVPRLLEQRTDPDGGGNDRQDDRQDDPPQDDRQDDDAPDHDAPDVERPDDDGRQDDD